MSERHFEISATVIRQLGEQLISDEVTALMELVKNAYDADASYARIVVETEKEYQQAPLHFTGDADRHGRGRKQRATSRTDAGTDGIPTGMRPALPQGYILVEDDGTGMDEGDIERGWLVISLSNKREMKRKGEVTLKYGRTPLGDKGLGRLSAQRLGSRLEMFTVKEHPPADGQLGFFSTKQYHVAVDWDAFHEGALLSTVPVFVDEAPRSNQTGTKLVVSRLRNPGIWKDQVTRKGLVAQLTQLISPFARTRPFKVYLSVDNDHYDFERIADRVRSVAVATHAFTWDGRRLKASGKIKLSTFRGKDKPEVFRHMLGNDQGEAFFEYLQSQGDQIPNLHRESGAWFISYSTSLDGASLGGIEYEDHANTTTDAGPTRTLVDPGPFMGEIDQFVYLESEAASLGDVFSRGATYKDYVKQHAGVRIYRDGFGIPPYGLGDNDWLGLQHGQTSGGSYYGLRPRNVIGYVEISARNNARLIEKTDREGFSLDSASRNFMRIAAKVVEIINTTLETLRRSYNEYKKGRRQEMIGFASPGELFTALRLTSSSARALEEPISHVHFERAAESVDTLLSQLHQGGSRSTPEAVELRDALERARSELHSAQETLHKLREVQERTRELDHAADWLEQQFDTIQNQLNEFSELAGLGLTAEAVSHELVTWVERLGRETRALTDTLRSRGTLVPEVATYSAYVRSAITTLRRQLNHLDPSLRYARERVDTISAKAFFRSTADYYLRMRRVHEVGIAICLENSFEDFSFRMNKGKFTQVIDNLVLNSVYWLREGIQRRNVENPTITFGSRRPFVTIADNGLGVDPAIEPLLFQPFVTTKPRGEGRGLGLFITQQLLDSVGCEISLDPQRNEHGRKYIFQIDLSGAIHAE